MDDVLMVNALISWKVFFVEILPKVNFVFIK